jgi:CheY-like chemotaxis protein
MASKKHATDDGVRVQRHRESGAEEIVVDDICLIQEVSPVSCSLSVQSDSDWLRILNDLNNQLTIVTGATDTVLARIQEGPLDEDRRTFQRHLDNSLQAARRIAEIVAGLGHIKVQPPAAEVPDTSRQRTRRERQTILLVEDEDQIRQMAKASLLALGYRVLEASGGKQAIDESARHTGRIDLVVIDFELDLWAPNSERMTGPQLANHLRSLRPKTKVVYISGIPEDDVRPLIDRDNFIQKPFGDFKQFANAVDSVLAK